jgi:hypothetical protein
LALHAPIFLVAGVRLQSIDATGSYSGIGPQVDIEKLIYSGSAWVIPILIAITFHEAAHA